MSEQNIPQGTLPDSLYQEALAVWQAIQEQATGEAQAGLSQLLGNNEHAQQFALAVSCSTFISQIVKVNPDCLVELYQSGDLHRSYDEDTMTQRLVSELASCEDIEQLMAILRQFRRREMLRIIWRDFNRLGSLNETIDEVSLLAETCIDQSVQFLQVELEKEYGQPQADGVAQQLIVIAMGKLGACELNVSSDIDLIFAYPDAGQTVGGKRSLSNQEFFIKLGQQLIQVIDKQTADGFVFRVDMRLRPYGQSGALVLNFNAMEEYYQDQGRDWERYALIKARVVSGDFEQGEYLMGLLKPFVFRRYVDYGAIESLRSMKSMINTEVRRRGLHSDVKLGHGGIREIEFIVQCFQLIRGGRCTPLQKRELLAVLEHCVEFDCLPREAADELREAYVFLRNTEHGIQGFADKQTQALPTDGYPQQALAMVMGFNDWEAFMLILNQHRDRVQQHFKAVVAAPEDSEEETEGGQELWPQHLDAESLIESGFSDGEQVSQLLLELRDSRRVQHMQAIGRERLDVFMPQLLEACIASADPDTLLQRLLPLINSILRRTAYLMLLLENPQAAGQLYKLCAASPWISEQMARYPVLLDELLDSHSLYKTPDRDHLRNELQQQVARILLDDLEAHMEALRYFKSSQVLKVAACEISGHLPLMQVSDNLTFIAEVILEHVLALAWSDMVSKHGRPSHIEDTDPHFAVVGYGKMGGIELGYGSDLDLVFIYDMPPNTVTDGERSLDGTVFYTRLGQRMIHILTANMAMGPLYEVDMRLRPSGASGLLVSSVTAYRDYQQKQAWTWEHQALVRARVVVGEQSVVEQIQQIRCEVLCQSRDEAVLREEVVSMREKMRDHLLSAESEANGQFSLKHGRGGIVDIEFMVQYAVLAWSHRFPELAAWSDNVRILEALEHTGVIEADIRLALTDAYIGFRSAAHELALQSQSDAVCAERFERDIELVQQQWQTLLDG